MPVLLMGRRWHLGAGISLMQTIIIKSNRLRDSPFADLIWMGFNNAVRDSFSRLSSPPLDVSLDLAPYARSRTFRRARGRDSAIWRTTSGDASRNFPQPACTIRSTVVSCSRFIGCRYVVPTLSLLFTALPPSFFYSVKRLGIAKKPPRRFFPFHVHFFFSRILTDS